MARAVMQEILPKDILRTDIRRNGGLGLDAIALEHLADGVLSVRQARALLMPAIGVDAELLGHADDGCEDGAAFPGERVQKRHVELQRMEISTSAVSASTAKWSAPRCVMSFLGKCCCRSMAMCCRHASPFSMP